MEYKEKISTKIKSSQTISKHKRSSLKYRKQRTQNCGCKNIEKKKLKISLSIGRVAAEQGKYSDEPGKAAVEPGKVAAQPGKKPPQSQYALSR